MSTLIDEITLKIAARVRGERTARRWSLDDLAERASVSKAMISKIERAEASPTAALLGRLSGAYGITLSNLLAEAEAPRTARAAPPTSRSGAIPTPATSAAKSRPRRKSRSS